MSLEDNDTAFLLFEKRKFKESLFFAHLSIEKILKAHYVRLNKDFAPKTHNLLLLISKSELKIDTKYTSLLGILMTYQLEGRYPDYNPNLPDINMIQNYLQQSRELLLWLTSQL